MTTSITTIVIDDEIHAREELIHLLEDNDDIRIVAEAGSGEKALELILQHQPKLVFIDIEMGEMSGIDLAGTLEQLKQPPLVVFATAYPNYAVQAVKLEAVDYLLKPFDEDELAETIKRIKNRLRAEASDPARTSVHKLAVEAGEKIFYLNPDDVLFFSREGRETKVSTAGSTYISKLTLKELKQKLEDYSFFRTHKSFLVNLKHIEELIPWFNGAYQLKMAESDESIPVSRNYVKELRDKLEL